ncbi:Uncharacterised protein [Vibrio cholerae]|nr:Uncharacterised protein [Vibrio cholerae]
MKPPAWLWSYTSSAPKVAKYKRFSTMSIRPTPCFAPFWLRYSKAL